MIMKHARIGVLLWGSAYREAFLKRSDIIEAFIDQKPRCFVSLAYVTALPSGPVLQ